MNSNNNFSKLIKTIDFFSQDLHQEQFVKYGHSYLHDLLSLDSSYLFLKSDFEKENSNFELMNSINPNHTINTIYSTENLSHLATLHGRYLTENFKKYFDEGSLDFGLINLIIPIINKSNLLGFIISEGNYDFSSNLEYLHAINIIINMSFSKIINDEIMTSQSEDLKAEIYNLNLLSHLTAQIISEKDLEKLYSLCIDSVRELTASGYTTIGFYDEISNSIEIKQSKDIVEHNEFYFNFKLKDYEHDKLKTVYSIEKDTEELKNLFHNFDDFKKIRAKYIILMIDTTIKGFITISDSVNEKENTPKTLFQVSSIAYFIYISILNAKYIQNIKRKNKIINQQIETLKDLNNSLEVINSCESLPELIDIMMTTLRVQFDIEKALFLQKDDLNNYEVSKDFGYEGEYKILDSKLPPKFYYNYSTKNLKHYFSKITPENNCFISAPIITYNLLENEIIGYIVITKTQEELQEYQLTAIKTISHLISPIIKSFSTMEHVKQSFSRNEKEFFISKVKEALNEKKSIELDFYINYKKLKCSPFEKNKLDFIEEEYFNFNNFIFSISYSPLEEKDYYDKSIQINSLDELFEYFK